MQPYFPRSTPPIQPRNADEASKNKGVGGVYDSSDEVVGLISCPFVCKLLSPPISCSLSSQCSLLSRKPEEGAPSGADGSGTSGSAGRGWTIKKQFGLGTKDINHSSVTNSIWMRESTFWPEKQERNKQHNFTQSFPLSKGLKSLLNLIGKLYTTTPQRSFSLIMSFGEVRESYLICSLLCETARNHQTLTLVNFSVSLGVSEI